MLFRSVLNIDESGVGNNLLLDSPKELGNGGQTVREKNDRDAQAAQVKKMYETAKAIEVIDQSKFVFVNDGVFAILKNSIGGETINIKIPGTTNATVVYTYSGGKVEAKNGSGAGVTINITQQ